MIGQLLKRPGCGRTLGNMCLFAGRCVLVRHATVSKTHIGQTAVGSPVNVQSGSTSSRGEWQMDAKDEMFSRRRKRKRKIPGQMECEVLSRCCHSVIVHFLMNCFVNVREKVQQASFFNYSKQSHCQVSVKRAGIKSFNQLFLAN